ncbi:hypothetical protein CRG98_009448 [Punica granatum]|uniref:Retrovirus-related Pol polyprotein from transposon TNT 1-94 n=1 Tax=Punica granatum TaxID=22663 RepID=A0A2I0KPB0_PUNGR|nr:hypothetical protein CRG98_009448 [Punica granatum]
MQDSKKGSLPMLHGISLSKAQSPSTREERDRMNMIQYASAIGSIMYAMLYTRSDISYALSAVSWKSSKQETIADYITEVEYIAASNAAKEAVWIKKFVTELAVVKEPRSHQRSKHILRRVHLIHEIIDRGDVKICRIPTDENLADPLTKPLVQRKHEAHTRSIGIRQMPDWL